ncbi:HupE/UreJ family protein [Mesorhizobium sp. B2-4-14]|uniref:HupE/UreJ family protein n=1 Tax=Mesorhizobium sp. B2-4-14 TaxID=2589935 RepID=UPI001126954C|nr:HupE/UreJ family protein [Mesorhizobium sp. B2-4-14]TPL02539.1 HupE/UreJ family protein [Mesorhizobium sp. B2-4-14]
MLKRLACLLLGVFATTAPAFAHLAPGDHGSFASGFTHPLFGPDHIVVMIAVGLWAVVVGGRAIWLVPCAFLGSMTVGYVLALAGVGLPLVEPFILASVVALGILIAAAIRLPTVVGALLVGVFALFHGAAHGGELGTADSLAFGAGLAVSTGLLHSAGIALGLFLRTNTGTGRAGDTFARVLGGLAAVLGVALAFASGS